MYLHFQYLYQQKLHFNFVIRLIDNFHLSILETSESILKVIFAKGDFYIIYYGKKIACSGDIMPYRIFDKNTQKPQ